MQISLTKVNPQLVEVVLVKQKLKLGNKLPSLQQLLKGRIKYGKWVTSTIRINSK
jgi:hypothetical protein